MSKQPAAVDNEQAAHGCEAQLVRTQTGRRLSWRLSRDELYVWELSGEQEGPNPAAGLQVSAYSHSYDLCHIGPWLTHRQTTFDRVYYKLSQLS